MNTSRISPQRSPNLTAGFEGPLRGGERSYILMSTVRHCICYTSSKHIYINDYYFVGYFDPTRAPSTSTLDAMTLHVSERNKFNATEPRRCSSTWRIACGLRDMTWRFCTHVQRSYVSRFGQADLQPAAKRHGRRNVLGALRGKVDATDKPISLCVRPCLCRCAVPPEYCWLSWSGSQISLASLRRQVILSR